MTLDPDQLRALLDVLIEKDIAEFEHEDETSRVRVVRGARALAPAVHVAAPHVAAPAAAGVPHAPASAPADANHVDVTSPFVGTFYRSPSPDAAAFVDIGSVVKAGQTLCIVEAMKLMNEIECDIAGTIVEIYAQNGKSVEYGQKLFRIKKA